MLISVEDKLRLIELLLAANLTHINVTSFVSPRVVPQMGDAEKLAALLPRRAGVRYDATVPNLKGARRAAEAGLDELVVFVSASEGASTSNVGRSVGEAMGAALEVVDFAARTGLNVVATVANAFGSAYEGSILADRVIGLGRRFRDAGVTTLALGDTSGEATPRQVVELVADLRRELPGMGISLHLHDTRGFALANALAAMTVGVDQFDSAVGGIGGSPFTRNAAGNLATESLVHMCDECGVHTGVDLEAVLTAYDFVAGIVGHELPGRLGLVGPSKKAAFA